MLGIRMYVCSFLLISAQDEGIHGRGKWPPTEGGGEGEEEGEGRGGGEGEGEGEGSTRTPKQKPATPSVAEAHARAWAHQPTMPN